MSKWCCLLIIISNSLLVYSQEDINFQQQVEVNQLDEEVENMSDELYLENFQDLLQHPINLNKANNDELLASNLFSEMQIISLLEHIAKNEALISLYELQSINGFNLDFIKSILPYVHIKNDIDDFHMDFSKLMSKGNHYLFFRYQQNFPKSKAYLNDTYLGHPSKIYTRYKYHYSNKLYYGLTAEKDAGEPFFKEKNKTGFDFYSFHFFWRKNKQWKAIALGDYQVNLGQGLVMWTGFGFNKSTQIQSVKKVGNVLRPYASVNEYVFLRGAAFTYQHKLWQFTPFISYKAIDSNLSFEDSLNLNIENNRAQLSGFHRTINEMENKGNIHELKTGGNIQYGNVQYHIGFNYLFTHFSDAITFNKQVYNQFQFQGNQLSNMSVDYHSLIKSFHLFGETAMSIQKQQLGFATLNGILFNPDKKIDMSLVYRYYAPLYQTHYYTKSFGESSKPNNEIGIFLGISMYPSKNLSIQSYFDMYAFQWLQFNVDKLGKGYDSMTQILYKPRKNLEFYIQYKIEEKEQNTKIDLGSNVSFLITESNRPYISAYFQNEIFTFNDYNQYVLRPNTQATKQMIEAATFITPQLTQRLRLHLTYKHNKVWTFQSRVELTFFNDKMHPKEQGFMIFQDLHYGKMDKPYSFSTRISLFEAQQYNARIYAYESDVLNQFSIPALYNTGIRVYLNAHYKVFQNMDVWLRFSHTNYINTDSKGSGNDEVVGNKFYELKAQVRYQF